MHDFDRSGWIYFVSADAVNLVKIGFTAHHPDQRFKSLQMLSPTPLKKLGVLSGTPDIEKNFHRRFDAIRRHGEWFESHWTLMEFVRAESQPWPDRGVVARKYTYEESWRLSDQWAARSFSDMNSAEQKTLELKRYGLVP